MKVVSPLIKFSGAIQSQKLQTTNKQKMDHHSRHKFVLVPISEKHECIAVWRKMFNSEQPKRANYIKLLAHYDGQFTNIT